MLQRSSVCRAVLVGLGGAVTGVALPTHAQAQATQGTERIEITGSLIRRLDSETALPVTTLRKTDLERLGVTNAEEAVGFIAQQQGGAVTSGSVSGTNGAASYVNLRQLGEGHTLVLLNGKRITSNPYATAAVDLNTLPLTAVERIETLTDGASSTYGTDAIAGVVNFITRRTYSGFGADAQAKVTEHGGGNVYTGGLIGGYGDLATQGWNIFGSVGYRDQKPMLGTGRQFMRTSYLPDRGFNGTSGTTFPANYTQTQGTGAAAVTYTGNPSLAAGCAPPTSISIPEVNGTRIRCFADTQAFTQVVPIQEQWNAFLRGSLAINPNNTASFEYFRSFNKVQSQIAPSPEAGLTLPSSSPYFPGNGVYAADPRLNAQNLSVGWRTVPLGVRQGKQINVTQRASAGVEGTVMDWDYQANALWSKAHVDNTFLNGYGQQRALLNGVAGCSGSLVGGTAANPTPATCATPLVVNGQRLYLNPFGNQTADGQAYLTANQVLGHVQDGESKLYGGTVQASHSFGKLGLGGNAISLALAVEARKEEMVYNTDIAKVSQASSSGLAGSGAQRQGERKIYAGAAEVNVPILKSLEVNASVRYDHYSDFGSTTDPKVSLRFTPVDAVLLRASANKGFSAPTLYSLYLPNSTTFTGTRYNDPVLCPNGTVNTAGGGVATRDCGLQFQKLQGGNAGLTPEKSDTYSAGIVLQPAPQVTLSLDYWNTILKNTVSTIGEQTIFGDPVKYAGLYVRCSAAPADRRAAIGACLVPGGDPLAYIIDTTQNLGNIRTNGFDLSATWTSSATPYGRFGINAKGTYVNKYRLQVEKGGIYYEANGNYSAQNGGPVIRFQSVTLLTWDYSAYSLVVANRYKQGYTDQNTQGAPYNVAPYNTNRVESQGLWDISAAYKGIKGLTLSAGVINVLDRDPPFSNQTARFQARGFDDRFYSPLGRVYQVSAKYEY